MNRIIIRDKCVVDLRLIIFLSNTKNITDKSAYLSI